jgi:hypothetical protein
MTAEQIVVARPRNHGVEPGEMKQRVVAADGAALNPQGGILELRTFKIVKQEVYFVVLDGEKLRDKPH